MARQGAMISELTGRLAALADDVWQDSVIDGDNGRWLPLVRLSTSEIWLGLDPAAQWVLGRPHGRAATSAAQPTQSWLLMHDVSESDFMVMLTAAADAYGFPREPLIAKLPIDDVLAMGLSSRSTHWTERALEWLQIRAIPEGSIELIRRLSGAKWMTQRARQLARRVLRRCDT
jgi:hypothetical protein